MDIKHKKEDGRSAERVKFFAGQNFNLIQESAYFQGFSGIRTKKNGGLVYLQAVVYLVEVTGFEPATFWSRRPFAFPVPTSAKLHAVIAFVSALNLHSDRPIYPS